MLNLEISALFMSRTEPPCVYWLGLHYILVLSFALFMLLLFLIIHVLPKPKVKAKKITAWRYDRKKGNEDDNFILFLYKIFF